MTKVIGTSLVGPAAGVSAEVEYGYFSRASESAGWDSQSITLSEGEVVVFLSTDGSFYSTSYGRMIITDRNGNSRTIDYTKLWGCNINDHSFAFSYPVESRTLVGPLIIAPTSDPYSGTYISYKIIRPETVVNNVISLPDDNNGDVDLLVESSTDLQNWTPVYSGTAGTSNDAAFFRTRLIQTRGALFISKQYSWWLYC